MDKEIILSVIISTYNRADLVCKNLRKMLRCKSDEIEFIVGDNASEDDTLKRLHDFTDPRVKIFSNKENYGIANMALLALNAKGKYFVYVNDRDFITPRGLEFICEKLKKIRTCDLVVNWIKPELREGYYTGRYIPAFCVEFRHPGTLIYLTEFAVKFITPEVQNNIFNNKLDMNFQLALVCNAEIVYLLNVTFLKQPPNLNEIKLQRKEALSDEMYLSPKTVTNKYLLFLDTCTNWPHYLLIDEYKLLRYTRFLEDTTITYFKYMKRDHFAERYDYSEHSANEWFINGIIFIKNIICSKKIKNKRLLVRMILATGKVYLNAIKEVALYYSKYLLNFGGW